MSSNMKKWLSLVTSVAVAFVMCLGCMGAYTSKVFAEEEPTDGIGVIISAGGEETTIMFDYTANQFYTLNGDEKVYIDNVKVPFYSAIKNTGCADNVKNASGPLLLSLFDAAGVDYTGFQNQIIKFQGNDGYTSQLMWKEIFGTDRYAFPKANRGGDPGDFGAAVEDEELEDMTEVPVILNLANEADQISFGQVSPSERNKSGWASAMVGEGTDKEGNPYTATIFIEDNDSPQSLPNVTDENVTPVDNSEVALGSEVSFGGEEKSSPYDGYIYYTTDGSTPDQFSAIYNWDTYKKDGFQYAPIAIDKAGDITIKTVEYKMGYEKSPVRTFHFNVAGANLSEVGEIIFNKNAVVVGTKPAVTVKADDYVLTLNNEYRLSFSNYKKVGEAKATVLGKGVFTGKVAKTFTVIPAQAKFAKVKAGKKKITVTIADQNATGVTSYQISYKKSSAKTWKNVNTKTLTKKIKKLKKGKKYNIKVRAYGPTGYGAYSVVKTVKVK